ncbi:hypothetical protein C5B42_05845 [Candidatus Cerribacteria bacterium 'Amazon FNV 2010 28 9']|uniref:Uncharacterized protein n=1 Tax=Candidatus Cerribacteria bacterium 'Amazon FNV 2010 28 9' TaxID=2081795 RepID=A0A317JLP7_9BACT|nr:MAG: hypothetical protein C5B42_05845 [Candidatus Cerribacteria bacterium 'Amazon FNV 2010 28 9']
MPFGYSLDIMCVMTLLSSTPPAETHPKKRQSPLLFAFILFIISIVLSIMSLFILPPQIPLLYSLAIPEQQLVSTFYIFVYPAAMGLILLLNILLISRFKGIDQPLKRLFSSATLLVVLLFFVGLIHTLYIFL